MASMEIRLDKPLENYVNQAEKIMKERMEDQTFKNLTTSKIRNILSMVSEIYNSELCNNQDELSTDSVNKLQHMRIRLVYEAGRDNDKDKVIKAFIEQAKILEYVKDIGKSREKFMKFAQYMEALVAYHRYFGGKE